MPASRTLAPAGCWKLLKKSYISVREMSFSLVYRYWKNHYIDLRDVVDIESRELKYPKAIKIKLIVKGGFPIETFIRKGEFAKLLKTWMVHHENCL